MEKFSHHQKCLSRQGYYCLDLKELNWVDQLNEVEPPDQWQWSMELVAVAVADVHGLESSHGQQEGQ